MRRVFAIQIQRHGARFPTSGATERYQDAVEKLQNAMMFKDDRLDFLNDFVYELGTDELVPLGATQ